MLWGVIADGPHPFDHGRPYRVPPDPLCHPSPLDLHVPEGLRGHPGRRDHTTRKISVVVILNDPGEFDGGELVLTTSHVEGVVEPQRGMVVVFPSFILHKVNPVTRGERWSATAWIEGPPFR